MSRQTKKQKKAGKLLAQGLNYTDAYTAAGYSQAQARKGKALLDGNEGMKEALIEEARRCPPEIQESLIEGRLISNIVSGEDRATASCKTLGSHRRLNMWEPEHQSRVVVYQVSPRLEALAEELAVRDDPANEGVVLEIRDAKRVDPIDSEL
jgi:hypothetical protein